MQVCDLMNLCVPGEEAFGQQHSDQELYKTLAAPFWTAPSQAGCLSIGQRVARYIQKLNTVQPAFVLH